VTRLREAAGRDLDREQTELLAASFRGEALSYQDIALLDEIDTCSARCPAGPGRRTTTRTRSPSTGSTSSPARTPVMGSPRYVS